MLLPPKPPTLRTCESPAKVTDVSAALPMPARLTTFLPSMVEGTSSVVMPESPYSIEISLVRLSIEK